MEVILVRSCHLRGDSRSIKMIADYVARDFRVTPLVWTRGVDGDLPSHAVAFRRRGLQGKKFHNVYYFLRWHIFLFWFLIRNANRRFILHTVDFDTALVTVPMARLFGKSVVYDGFDHFASSREGAFASLFDKVERFLVRQADILILPDETRVDQYGLKKGDVRICVIANMPDMAQLEVAYGKGEATPEVGPIHIVYVGTLEAKHRGLEFIPRLCEAFPGRVRFTVGGNGALDSFFDGHAARLPNLRYIGYQPYKDALRVMMNSDVLYGPYLLSSKNHPFAAPNKMFEHLALGRPLITTEGTPPGRFAQENGTGYIFDGSYESLNAIVSTLVRSDARSRGDLARKLWLERYSHLREDQVAAFFGELDIVLKRYGQAQSRPVPP